ncbi:MAG: aminotransferase class V-fold PLP-dependent enzyme, partial [Candidatus Aminicenantia bacterium]
ITGIGGLITATAIFSKGNIEKVKKYSQKLNDKTSEEIAQDEDFWFEVQNSFTIDRSIINLNNGGVHPSPKIVQDAVKEYMDFGEKSPTYTMWEVLQPLKEVTRTKLAKLFGCSAEEIAITRNTTESLQNILLGFPMNSGEEILTTTQDYPSMQNALNQRALREGVVINRVKIPTPVNDPMEVADIISKAITPKTKLILISHIVFLTGQIMPVKEICKVAHEKGVEVVVDGAHAFAHLDFQVSEIDCDYYATSLHKWLMAPKGTGFLYVKKDKISKIWPLFPYQDPLSSDIRKFEAIGTHQNAIELGIDEAIAFHNGIGSKRKEARLRYLKEYWAKRLSEIPVVKFRVSLESKHSCGLANFYVEGIDPSKFTNMLFQKHRIVVTPITHEEVPGIRVTPSIYTRLEELDIFIETAKKYIKEGI